MPHALIRTDRNQRVLVVEDDADSSMMYAETLGDAGFDVATAGTLKEAAAAARAHRPNVVILDCNLPDGNGLDLLASWKRSSEMGSVPIVVVTAFSEPAHIDAASDGGADGFMVKPCDGDALTSFVTRVLAASKPTKPVLRLRMSGSVAAAAPPIIFPSGMETAILHRIDDSHFHAQCASCHRSSPVVRGTMQAALRRVVELGWLTGRTGAWTCPICHERASRPPSKGTKS